VRELGGPSAYFERLIDNAVGQAAALPRVSGNCRPRAIPRICAGFTNILDDCTLGGTLLFSRVRDPDERMRTSPSSPSDRVRQRHNGRSSD
jgi:hypothetical protein